MRHNVVQTQIYKNIPNYYLPLLTNNTYNTRMKAKTVLLFSITALLLGACSSPAERAAKALAVRIVPDYAGAIKFEEKASEADLSDHYPVVVTVRP